MPRADGLPGSYPVRRAEAAAPTRRRYAETATPVCIAFAAACPEATRFKGIAPGFQPAGP